MTEPMRTERASPPDRGPSEDEPLHISQCLEEVMADLLTKTDGFPEVGEVDEPTGNKSCDQVLPLRGEPACGAEDDR